MKPDWAVYANEETGHQLLKAENYRGLDLYVDGCVSVHMAGSRFSLASCTEDLPDKCVAKDAMRRAQEIADYWVDGKGSVPHRIGRDAPEGYKGMK